MHRENLCTTGKATASDSTRDLTVSMLCMRLPAGSCSRALAIWSVLLSHKIQRNCNHQDAAPDIFGRKWSMRSCRSFCSFAFCILDDPVHFCSFTSSQTPTNSNQHQPTPTSNQASQSNFRVTTALSPYLREITSLLSRRFSYLEIFFSKSCNTCPSHPGPSTRAQFEISVKHLHFSSQEHLSRELWHNSACCNVKAGLK